MPNIKSAKKRVDTIKRNYTRNKSNRSELHTALKKYDSAIAAGDASKAETLLPETFAILDEKVTKGIIHKNKADRKKAAAAKNLDTLKANQSK
jgi:small subunit ribosomal protein S20